MPPKGHIKLTPELEKRICDEIRMGAFPTVAAGKAGICRNTYWRWMRGKCKAQRAFQKAVAQAKDDARSDAEARVYNDNPLAWLKTGPARDNGPEDPGWTERQDVNIIGDLDVQVIYAGTIPSFGARSADDSD